MARPGTTKSFTLTDAWQRLATVYDPMNTPMIKDGGEVASGVLLSVITQDAKVAFGPTTPAFAAHPMYVGDSAYYLNSAYIANCWVANNVAGSNAVLVVTPEFGP